MAESKHPGGRPPKFTDPAEMQAKIDAYFKECEGELLEDKNGDIVYDKFGHPVVVGAKPLTVTGLAIALGFTSRQALLNYQGKAEYRKIISDAKLKVENYAEMRLYDKDGSNGARFSLQNNFKNWNADKESDDKKAPSINIICDIPKTFESVQDAEADQEAVEALKASTSGAKEG